ncbi:hypothetical protein LAZ67_12002447 [Cordylochernes scorpioides]|uniref:Cuticle protein 10.9 n=1 Tax=Cordylochernes scorpioides TaxID=51811 RepID=A0ABY6L2L8_9ARAC|nr:hypothetical protein LAZ67_12002447 [Cordylochernes scorpioides]
MVRANRRITLEEIEDGLNEDCSQFSVHKIVSETLGYRKVSARWVDKWLKEAAGEWYNTGITKLVDRMKKRPVIFFALFAICHAQRYYDGRVAQEYPPIPYSFQYVAPALGGSSSRQETGDGAGRVQGSYTVTDDDGRQRYVEYVADENGFRASVQTNELGTRSESPAGVSLYSSAPDPFLGQIDFAHQPSYRRSPYGASQ